MATLCLLLISLLEVSMSAEDTSRVVKFYNEANEDLTLSWISFKNELVVQETFGHGKHAQQDTFKGHVFEIKSANPAAVMTVTRVRIGESGKFVCMKQGGDLEKLQCHYAKDPTAVKAESKYKGQAWDRIVKEEQQKCREELASHPNDINHFCLTEPDTWSIMQCKLDYPHEVFKEKEARSVAWGWTECLRQPQEFQNFTRAGFKLGSAEEVLGKDFFREIQQFWLQNRLTRQCRPENHNKIDAALSGCESDTWMLKLPADFKARIFAAYRPVLARWTGFEPEDLEESALYGVRMYRKGSVLNWHVDRKETHAISAILEFGYLGFGTGDDEIDTKEPVWPLRIRDHFGEYHEIPNNVGQSIYYESATCPHGRPDPFPGREFANVFVHFRPKGWPQKYVTTPEGLTVRRDPRLAEL